MAEIRISNHAWEQMSVRGISEAMVLEIIATPQQKISEGSEKMIYQSVKFFEKEKKDFLVRVFANLLNNLIL